MFPEDVDSLHDKEDNMPSFFAPLCMHGISPSENS